MEDEYTEKVYDIAAEPGSTLLNALKLNGIPIQCLDYDWLWRLALCGGRCMCGMCAVNVSERFNELIPKNPKEKERLKSVGKEGKQ